MKTDRLIGIIMYLLNRDKVTAKELAERFEVSTRTIIRDINALGQAGVPVVSDMGVNGGYAMNQSIFMNLNVCREEENIDVYLKTIEQAISDKQVIAFDYTGADNVCSVRETEPLALNYRWYAWYLFAYCNNKQDYRIFKLSRIRNLRIVGKNFERIHSDINILLKKKWGEDGRKQYHIKLRCKGSVRTEVGEYLNGNIIEEYPDGDFIYSVIVPENERMWFSLLLGFGNEVEVLEPEELRIRLKEKAEEVFRLYKNGTQTNDGWSCSAVLYKK